MALYYDLPVYQDVYRLILKLFELTKKFPREYTYTLGQDLKRDGIVVIPFSIAALSPSSLPRLTTVSNREATSRRHFSRASAISAVGLSGRE